MFSLIAIVCAAYLLYYYITVYFQRRKAPPGPMPTPILGNLIQFLLASTIPSKAFEKMAKVYGEIFQLEMGTKTLVVCASMDSIKAIYDKPATQGRECSGVWYDRNFKTTTLGIAFSDGPAWEKTKQWTIRNLRDYGFGKSLVEIKIHEELVIFFNQLDDSLQKNGNIIQVSKLFMLSVFKIMWQMIAGELQSSHRQLIEEQLEKSEIMLKKGIFGAGVITAFPFLRHIFSESTGHKASMDFYRITQKAGKQLIDDAYVSVRKKMNERNCEPENLVEAFVFQMINDEKLGAGPKETTIFTEKNFIVIYMDLLQASSDTTSGFLEYIVLAFAMYPDVQEKVYNEVIQNISEEQKASYEHRKTMVYTRATLLEAHRHCQVLQSLVPRLVINDFYYKQWLIKKGSMLVANLQSAYNDPKIWNDPLAFKPERFLSDDHRIINESLITPFGLGKRYCPGESLASQTSFLYTVALVQRYKFMQVPGSNPLTGEMQEGFTRKPYPFEVKIIPRK